MTNMRVSVFKRCTRPVRRDGRGRNVPCPKAHGSWSYKVNAPERQPGHRRQVVKGGSATKREAEQAMAELVAKAARRPVIQISRQQLGDYLTDWLQVIRPTPVAGCLDQLPDVH